MSTDRVKWKLNGEPVESPAGITILQACRDLGVEIPSLCKGGESGHSPSCMVCFVHEENRGLISSCSEKVEEGISIRTAGENIRVAVSASAAMLFNEHGGDCLSSCSLACSAGLDSSHMSRFIRSGDYGKAARYAVRKLIFPELLSKICEAPCKKACRRNKIDEPVEIPLLHSADVMKHFTASSKSIDEYKVRPKALISGSSPETWSSAHILNLQGYDVTIACGDHKDFLYDLSGLRQEFLHDRERLEQSGLSFTSSEEISATDLKNYEYILTGEISGVINDPSMLVIEEFPDEKSFLKRIKYGRDYILKLVERPDRKKKQISVIRSFIEEEKNLFLKHYQPPQNRNSLNDQARSCLLCRCASEANCSLKKLGENTGSCQQSGSFLRNLDIPEYWGELVYEFSKCINCRLCVKKSREEESLPALGIAFKGLETRIIHLDGHLFSIAGAQIMARTCPTSAMRMKYAFENREKQRSHNEI